MAVENLLSRLERVKQTGQNRWIASCSTHDDKHPSLTIRETSDGVVLVKCWAGCETENILSAVGLTFSDLFPEKSTYSGSTKRPFPASDILRCVAHEALVCVIASAALTKGKLLSVEDHKRLYKASSRLQTAVEAING